MGLLQILKRAFAPTRIDTTARVVADRPLHEQFQRIGGGITPLEVSDLLRQADSGQPARLIDLTSESRERDGHFQSVCYTREQAVALSDLEFFDPPKATAVEKKATELCRQIRDDFYNWPTLLEHLAGSFLPGHATSELEWQKTRKGQLVPFKAWPLHAREFIFARTDGQLRYRRSQADTVGIDLLEENPGRIVQIQRRIVGDVPAREGLMRVLVWAALFRNWDLKDWIALAEVGWKPWRIGTYELGTHQDEINKLVRALERIGSDGLAAIPSETDLRIEWPKGQSSGNSSVHREFFDTVGREMSKATIGTTTTTEAGPNGDRAATQTRDQVRKDIKEADCRAVAAALRYCMFMPAVALNFGDQVRCPFVGFLTEESEDLEKFSRAIGNVVTVGLKVPAKWVRDEMGMPEPSGDEEVLVAQAVKPANDGNAPPDGGGDEPPDPQGDNSDAKDNKTLVNAKAAAAKVGDGLLEGQGFIDALVEHSAAQGEQMLRPDVQAIARELEVASDYEDLRNRLRALYVDLAPDDLTELVTRAVLLAEMAGRASVNQDAAAE